MSTERDPYAVLQVSRHADAEVIKAAYRALARAFHPDGATPDLGRMTEVNRAYDHLKTPDARRRYDAGSGAGVPVGPGWPSSGASWNAASPPPASPFHSQPLARRRMARAAQEPGAVIDFGRYAGWRIADLATVDPDYLRWLSRHSAGIRYRESIARSLPGDTELGRPANILG